MCMLSCCWLKTLARHQNLYFEHAISAAAATGGGLFCSVFCCTVAYDQGVLTSAWTYFACQVEWIDGKDGACRALG